MNFNRFSEYDINKLTAELNKYKIIGRRTVTKKDLLDILNKIEYDWMKNSERKS